MSYFTALLHYLVYLITVTSSRVVHVVNYLDVLSYLESVLHKGWADSQLRRDLERKNRS